MELKLIKRPYAVLLGGFFIVAGLYHFIHPSFYYPLIPDYLPQPVLLNYGVGFVELLLGVFVLQQQYRKLGGYGIMALLVLLIPSHVFFIQQGSCVPQSLCVPEWISWGRLVLVHPLLIYWGYTVAKKEEK